MKAGRYLLLGLVMLLAGCSIWMPGVRRQQYVDNHPNLSSYARSMIEQGKVANGMTKAQVLASWGQPWTVTQASWGDTWCYSIQTYGGCTYVFFNNANRVIGWSE